MLATRDALNAFLDRPAIEVPHAESGPLAGLTLAVKDIYDIAGQKTGGGNPHKLAEAPVADRTAPALQKLLDAGARFVGRTQTDELTFSLMGQNAHYPEPINSAAPDRVTGGSSSGSAAAVAGGLADIALGSDTGGSIRAPASFCGLVGLRTTHGAISLQGAMPLAPSLDTFGWFARDIEIYARVGEVLLGGSVRAPEHVRLLRMRELDALLLGSEEAEAYEHMLALVTDTLGPTELLAAPSQPIDDLYWAFRKIQAYEAWAVHGPFISGGDRQLGPGVKERFEFGATLGCEVTTPRRRSGRRFARRFALFSAMTAIWCCRPSRARPRCGRHPSTRYRIIASAPCGSSASRASPAFRRSRCRSGASTAPLSASRSSVPPARTWR